MTCSQCCCFPFKWLVDLCKPGEKKKAKVYFQSPHINPAPTHTRTRTWTLMNGKMRYEPEERVSE